MRSPPPPQAPSSGPVYLPSQQQQQQQGGRDSRSRGEAPRGRDSQQYDHLWNANAPPQKQHHKPPQRDIHNDARKESYMSNTESETSPESEFTSFDQPSREEGSDRGVSSNIHGGFDSSKLKKWSDYLPTMYLICTF